MISADSETKGETLVNKTAEKKKKNKKKKVRPDKYALYQEAVQEPEADVRFFRRCYKSHFDRHPRSLREDFCGTAFLCCTWVKKDKDNIAYGVDLDPEPLAWGRQNNVARLKNGQAERVTLIEGNALDVHPEKVDVVCALNFSYWTFQKREQLLAYFRSAYRNLDRKGLFVLDIQGGTEVQQLLEEPRECDGFTYVWDQDRFDAITNRMQCYIHFEMDDGKVMRRAFSYEWRLWSLPEVRDVLVDAGFQSTEVYWEGTDRETGEGNGVFKKKDHAHNEECWISYVVGVKDE